MWLLDANMDVHLLAFFRESGIPCEAATSRGWGALSNGELVTAAVEGGFTCLLTHDRLFADSAGREAGVTAEISIVLVHLPQRPWREYVDQFRAAWANQPIVPVPGAVTHWPALQE